VRPIRRGRHWCRRKWTTSLGGDDVARSGLASARATAWRCPTCGRGFARTGQQHSCRVVALEEHLPEGDPRRPLFDALLAAVRDEVGRCDVVSLPCCVHLAGRHDFLAVLPRKGRLELRFTLPRALRASRVRRAEPISRTAVKHSLDIAADTDIDAELLGWVREAYHQRDVQPPTPGRAQVTTR
jgi:hypothetical protein